MVRRNSYRKYVIASVVVILLVLGVGAAYWHSHKSAKSPSAPSETINYKPPTTQEQKAGDEQKAANDAAEKSQQAASTNKATVLISDANQYESTVEVRAYVSNVVEDGGTCKTIFTKSGKQVQKTTTAFMDASSTQCGAIDIPRTAFPSSGVWGGSVTYHSNGYDGTSAPFNVTVQ